MNYIEMIRIFWRCDAERSINPTDTRLYFYLAEFCNSLGWKQPFGHSDRFLAMKIGVSVNTLRDSKQRLQQLQLIDFTVPEKASKGIEGQTRYWFPTVSNNDTVKRATVSKNDTVRRQTVSTNDTVQKATVSGTVSGTVSETVSETVSNIDTDIDTNNKLNETKPNTTEAKASGTVQNDELSSSLKKKEKKGSAPKKKKESEGDGTLHWTALVKVWFDFNEANLNICPSFSGQDPRSLKSICEKLQKRSIAKSLGWEERLAIDTLNAFLTYAYGEKWLKENFLLPNLDRQFDKIISNAANKQSVNNTAEAFSRIDAMFPKGTN